MFSIVSKDKRRKRMCICLSVHGVSLKGYGRMDCLSQGNRNGKEFPLCPFVPFDSLDYSKHNSFKILPDNAVSLWALPLGTRTREQGCRGSEQRPLSVAPSPPSDQAQLPKRMLGFAFTVRRRLGWQRLHLREGRGHRQLP